MIGITRAARRQIESLTDFYVETKHRPEAARRLSRDLREARRLILFDPTLGLPYPRPYPALAAFGLNWRLVRVYWISWRIIDGQPVVTNVFHVSADIERRATPTATDIDDW